MSTSSRVLVTGGSGFIGTFVLRELLSRGLIPVVVDQMENRSRWKRVLGEAAETIEFHACQLTDHSKLAAVFSRTPIQHVIHLAALLTPDCQSNPIRGCEINVLGTTQLFELSRQHGVKSVAWASSMAVFGPEPGEAERVASGAVNHPPSFYGAFKRACELIAEQYWMHFQLPSVGLRPHVVYGPEREVGISAGPSLAARAVARSQPFAISFRGSLGYDFVTDVARAFVRSALEAPAGATVVDLPSEKATIEQIVELLTELVPESAGSITINGPALPSNDSPNQSRLNDLFPDWAPTSLRDGLRQTIAYYREPCRG